MAAPRAIVGMGEVQPAAPVSEQTRTELARFRELCGSEAGWKLVVTKRSCSVWSSKTASSDTVRIRVDCSPAFVAIPAAAIWAVLTEQQYFKQWDSHCVEYRILEKLEEDATTGVWLSYYRVSMPPPLTDRDWALQRIVFIAPDASERIVLSRSIVHPTLPPVAVGKSLVRANCIGSGFRVTTSPDLPGGCRVVYFAHNEFRGHVPVKLANWVYKQLAASIVSKLHHAAAQLCATPPPAITPAIAEPPPAVDDAAADEEIAAANDAATPKKSSSTTTTTTVVSGTPPTTAPSPVTVAAPTSMSMMM